MNHQPRKRFGQNFLRDAGVIRQIAGVVHPISSDHLVEIGPGEGALTRELLSSSARMDAIELDRDLAAYLQRQFAETSRFCLHSADALRFDFSSLKDNEETLRIVGNLPYNISTPLLFHLFEQLHVVKDMHFMLQKEVVERLCASPGSKEYGRLTVMAGYYCRAEHLFDVGPEAFYPAPKVISSIIRLIPHPKPPVEVSRTALSRVVAAAFSQRRKTLRNALRDYLDETGFEAAGIDSSRRAETLSLAEYAALVRVADVVLQNATELQISDNLP